MSGALTGTAGYPSFNTGDTSWNSALGSLAHSLFPDPSRAAAAYYYGTEARNKLVTTDLATSQAAAAARALAQQVALDQGGQPPPVTMPTYHTGSVAGGPQVMDFPGVNGGPVAGGGASLPNIMTGTPPPSASPAPGAGAPVAPNNTASDGTVPPDQHGQGLLHPGSILPPDGGRKMAGPANSDGSPKPPAISLGTIMAMGAAAGYDANKMKAIGEAYITSAAEHGVIPWPTARAMLGGIGNNAPYESDQATKRTGMTLAEEEAKFRRTPFQGVQGVDPETGQPTALLPGGVQTGTPLFNQTVVDRMNQPTLVYQRRPDGTIDYNAPPVQVPSWQATRQGLPLYQTGQQGGPQPGAGSEEAILRKGFVNDVFADAYKAPLSGYIVGTHQNARSAPTTSAENAVTDYAEYLRERSRNTMTVQQAYSQAQHDLAQQGFLPTDQQVGNARSTHTFGAHPALRSDPNNPNVSIWSVPLLKPYLSPRGNGMMIGADVNQSGAGGAEAVDTSTMRPAAPAIPTNPAAAPPVAAQPVVRPNAPPAGGGSLGKAPAGWLDGNTYQDANGRKVTVRGGQVYPAQ